MAPTLRKRSINNVRYVVKSNTSESDDYSPIHKKQHIERSKNVPKKVSAIHDSKDSSNSIIQPIEIKDKSNGHINVTEDNTNAKSLSNIDYQKPKRVLSEVDNNSVQVSVKNKRIHRKGKVVSDDSSSNSDTLSRGIKRKRLKLLNDKKINDKIKPLIHGQTIENGCKKDCYSNLNLPGPSSFSNQNKLINEEKEETIYNSKSFVIASMEELMHTFSKFEQQIKRFLSMFAKNHFMTPQDAEDAMFVSNCIVNKAKEELTEQQQELITHYPQLCMKHKCKYIVQSKQCASTNNVQAHDTCSRYSINNKTVSPKLKEHLGEAIENVRKSDQIHDECVMQEQDTIINNDSLQMQNISCSNSGTNRVSLNLKEQPVIKNSKKDMQQENIGNTKDVQSKQCVKNDNGQVRNEENSSSTTDMYMLNFKKQSAAMTKNLTKNFYKDIKSIENQESIRNIENEQCKQGINDSNLEVQNVSDSDSENEIFSPNFKIRTLAVIENSRKNNKDVKHQKTIKKNNNAENKKCVSYENLQAQDDICSQASNDTVIIQISSEEQSLGVTKDLKNAGQRGTRNGRVEPLLEGVGTSAFEMVNDKVVSENNRITSPSLVDESQLLNSCLEDSEENNENSIEHKRTLVNCDSDVSSTCSTVTFFPVKYRTDEMQNTNKDELEKCTSYTFRNPKDDKVPVQKIRRINSEETIIIPHSKRTSFNKLQWENKGYNNLLEALDESHSSLSDENIFSVKKSNSNVSNMNNLKRKSQSTVNSDVYQAKSYTNQKLTSGNKYEFVDKKLEKRCQVVIEKFNID